MLNYKTIRLVHDAERRIKRPSCYRYSKDDKTLASDQLLVFAYSEEANTMSLLNLEYCLELARSVGSQSLVFDKSKIQFVGQGSSFELKTQLENKAWVEEFESWAESKRVFSSRLEQSTTQCYTIRIHVDAFTTKKHCGIYNVATGRRITNRREIITGFWNCGFAAWRGRPLSVAELRWSGTAQELTDLTNIAEKYRVRKHISDVARKMVMAYNGINRYAAWPGAW